VWHSHRHTCSIQKVERFTRENRSCRRPANIPLAVREAPAFTPGRMSLVAVVVALVVLASVIVFNIGGDSDGTSADASIDFKQTSSGVSVQVVSNNNVEEFKILSPDGKENRVSGNVGSSTSIIGVDGTYTVIAIMPDGEEQVLATKTVEGLDYSGVFVVLQDEEEGEVNATLSQQFDNVEDYDLSLQTNNNGDEEVALNSFGYETQQNLLSEQLVQESPSLGEKIALIRITSNRDIETIQMDKFGDSEVNVNIRNPRETVTEDVTVEYINKTGISQFKEIEQEDIIYKDDVSVRPEQSVLLTRTLNVSDMEDLTNQTLEGGDTVEFWVRLSHTTSMDNDFYATVDVTVPESSIDATIEGTFEICESPCN